MRPSANWLLALIPATLALEHAGAPDHWVFFAAALAIVPIARLIVRSTGELSTYTGEALGDLLNATFGNAPELIIALVAPGRGSSTWCAPPSSAPSSPTSCSPLGIAFVVSGLRVHTQTDNAAAARAYSSMMLIAAISLTVPSAFSRVLAPEETMRAEALLNVGVALVLLAVYVLYLVFMLKTRPNEFAGEAGYHAAHEGPRWSMTRAIGGLVVPSLRTSARYIMPTGVSVGVSRRQWMRGDPGSWDDLASR